MELTEVVVLAIIQGLTEFLPISSSGHLAAARHLFGVSDLGGSALDAFLHIGTLLAALVYFRRIWWDIFCSVVFGGNKGRGKRGLAARIVVASVPAAVAGYFFWGEIDVFFRSPLAVAGGLLVTAVALALVEMVRGKLLLMEKGGVKVGADMFSRVSLTDALLIGLAQMAALLPGVSRSGVTIAAGRSRGLSQKQAVTFSFLLSVPVIAGAGLVGLVSLFAAGSRVAAGQLLVGLIVSFACGLMAIYLLFKVVERMSFWPFVVYLFLLAGLLIYVG